MSGQRPAREALTSAIVTNKDQIEKLRTEMSDKQHQMQQIRELNPDPSTDAGKNRIRAILDGLERQYLERKADAERLEHEDANATMDAITFQLSVPACRTQEEGEAEIEEEIAKEAELENEIMKAVDRLEPQVSHAGLTVAVLKNRKSVCTGWTAVVVPRLNQNLLMAKYKGEEKAKVLEALTALRDGLEKRLQDFGRR